MKQGWGGRCSTLRRSRSTFRKTDLISFIVTSQGPGVALQSLRASGVRTKSRRKIHQIPDLQDPSYRSCRSGPVGQDLTWPAGPDLQIRTYRTCRTCRWRCRNSSRLSSAVVLAVGPVSCLRVRTVFISLQAGPTSNLQTSAAKIKTEEMIFQRFLKWKEFKSKQNDFQF